jgi:hypothetical protein
MTKYIPSIRSAKELVENITKKTSDKRKAKTVTHHNETEIDEFDLGVIDYAEFILITTPTVEYLGLSSIFKVIEG